MYAGSLWVQELRMNITESSEAPDMLTAALWYAEHNVPVFPIRWPIGNKCSCGNPDCGSNAGKHPLTEHGFKDATTDPARVEEWWLRWPQANIGIPTSGFLVLDCDPRHGGTESLDDLYLKHGRFPDTAEAITGGGGRHFVFADPGIPVPAKLADGLDLKSAGGYIVVAPSLHVSGNRYEWDGIEGEHALLHPAAAPAWLLDCIRKSNTANKAGGNASAPAVESKIPEGARNSGLASLAGTMRRRGFSAQAIESALLTENRTRCSPPLPEVEVRTIATSVARYEPAGPPQPPEPYRDPYSDGPDLLRYMLNDAGNACRIMALHGAGLRYCHALRRWLVWDGRRWASDDAGRAEKLAKETALIYLSQAVEKDLDVHVKFAKQSLDHRRVTSALASAECELPITPAELDTRADVLNCLNGMVDLQTGALEPHNPSYLITKLCQHAYNPAADCPRFLAFLHQIMGAGDTEIPDRTAHLVDYLQRAFGYSLTGLTSEKAVFILHGGGNNGKTTLLSTISKIIEEYAIVLQVDSLMVKQESNNSQADLADLRGARFVMTSETEEGQRLNEGKLKRITQGMGRIKAVRKYENPITFDETHKLWMDANHRPDVRGVDAAIWNRLHLIPFDVTIPDGEIDRELPAKLQTEAEGILAWMVAGAQRWYTEGLGRPAEVSAAGEEWRHASNQVGRFVDECCIRLLTAEAKARNLYGAYKKWAEEAGEKTESETKFAVRMAALGYAKKHGRDGTAYLGIGFRDTTWG